MTTNVPAESRQTPPVLLIVFKRPGLTRQLMNSILQAHPARLYVACDGPRSDHADDAAKVMAVREVIREYSGKLHPEVLFQETNLGCGKAVSTAIEWFFEHEEEGIILEDDCLPDASFYRFCGEMLARFRNTSNVMQVAGYNAISGHHDTGADYHFTNFGWQWGWATWRRAWQHFDLSMASWPEFKEMGLHHGPAFYPLRVRVFDEIYSGSCDTWDYQWHYAISSNAGLSVVPRFSLVQNIGIGLDGTHGASSNDEHLQSNVVRSVTFPLRHSRFIVADPKYEHMLIKTVHHVSRLQRLTAKLRQVYRRHRVPSKLPDSVGAANGDRDG